MTEEMEDFGFEDEKCTVREFLEECGDQMVSMINTQIKLMAKKSKVYSFSDIVNGDYGKYLKMQLVFNKKYKVPKNADFLGKK